VIAGVNEMTSNSSNGSTRVSLQFDLNRKIDAAAREVQAAINASRADLPATLRSNPTYRKANPASAPVIILALTSKTRSPGQIYDEVSNLVQQKIAQVPGVGDVELGGGSLPGGAGGVAAVCAEPLRRQHGRRACRPAGQQRQPAQGRDRRQRPALPDLYRFQHRQRRAQGRRLPQPGGGMAQQCGHPAADVAEVQDGVENINTLGLFNGEPAVIVLVTRQPGANVIATVDGVRACCPSCRPSCRRTCACRSPRTAPTPSAPRCMRSKITLLISIVLVVLVVSAFLRSARATIIPAVATVVSLLGTFGVMYLLGFSLNNLSLMALTVATGFVVDDAIVVLENTSRHIEAGMDRFKAALLGAREVGFTVLSISLSLVAVFIPLLFMGGQVGPAVPRVRRHAVGGGADLAADLADHHAHDVRLAAQARCARKAARARRALV
jgi:multidrug efflux pump